MNYAIIGATSAIAKAAARQWVAPDAGFYLIGRDAAALDQLRDDLVARGAASVDVGVADLADLAAHEALVEQISAMFSHIDVVLIAHGVLPDQSACEASAAETLAALETNALSHISLLTHLANRMEKQGAGTLAVISSVAGDRGRQSNYVYGAAKSMVSTFLGGLRNRLHSSGVQVLDIRPGFVDTPMTAHLEKGVLWASPDAVASGILRAVDKRRDIVYLPGFWRLIMLVIRTLPEALFKRLRL